MAYPCSELIIISPDDNPDRTVMRQAVRPILGHAHLCGEASHAVLSVNRQDQGKTHFRSIRMGVREPEILHCISDLTGLKKQQAGG